MVLMHAQDTQLELKNKREHDCVNFDTGEVCIHTFAALLFTSNHMSYQTKT